METVDEMIRKLDNDRFPDFLDPEALMQALKKLKELAPEWDPS